MAVLAHEGIYSVMYGSVAVPVGSGYRPGYVARPDKAGRFPVVLLVPGLEGLTAHHKSLARRMARRGLACVVIDHYRTRPADHDEALVAYAGLDDQTELGALDEAQQYLGSPDVTWAIDSPVGMLGVDIGGRFALLAAAHRPWVGSVAVISTPLTGDETRALPVEGTLDHLPVPVLGLYGANDPLIANETVDEAQRRNAAGTWLLYQDAGHAFADENSDDYHPASAEDAITRLIGFFSSTLPAAQESELG